MLQSGEPWHLEIIVNRVLDHLGLWLNSSSHDEYREEEEKTPRTVQISRVTLTLSGRRHCRLPVVLDQTRGDQQEPKDPGPQ